MRQAAMLTVGRHRWRTRLIPLLLAIGCSDSSSGPKGLTVTDIVGSWELSHPANAQCSGFTGAATYYFDVPSTASALEDGSVNVVSQWDVVKPDRYDWLVTGNFNVKTGAVVLNFWHTPLVTGSEFTGTIDGDGRVSGTLRDPKPGYNPHYVLGSCTFAITGHRSP